MSNRLIHSSSPYLLQHAHNPVDWYEWGDEALNKAKVEDKLIIVSIGYSACHWCHVMEKQCFENEELAALMNQYYICIKVDREERPDIDQIYMDAIHAMGLQGGWPLNVFLMPDSKPFYGGTYFPPQQWGHLLLNIQNALEKDRDALQSSAEGFTRSIGRSEIEKYGLSKGQLSFDKMVFDSMFLKLEQNFDTVKGGNNRAPKFPMPCTYEFLLNYHLLTGNASAIKHVYLTLDNMAMGGIYDQIGGGFSRYSTDTDWLVPHFEKMLYDNAQLISLYCFAFRISKQDLYSETVFGTIDFLKEELLNKEGGFYSALDADSEGVEGKYYIWDFNEFSQILGDMASTFSDYYSVSRHGNWEEGNNILHRKVSDSEFSKYSFADLLVFKRIKSEINQKLLAVRRLRVPPGLDDKVLCSWNGLMLKALSDAYLTFGREYDLILAERAAKFILDNFYVSGKLLHTYKNGKSSISGYLEDYAAVVRGLIQLYQCTFNEDYLLKSKELVEYALAHFYDERDGLFYFTDSESEKLIARKKEIMDNVIPSSNALFFESLFLLGHLFEKMHWVEMAEDAVSTVAKLTAAEPYYMAHWGKLAIIISGGLTEIAILGPQANALKLELFEQILPSTLLCGTDKESTIPVLQRPISKEGKTAIYICRDFTCLAPVYSIPEVLDILEREY